MARLQDHSMKNDFLDLQSRLEHLITYSSQLVFVSGDGMGKQLSFAQHFLSHQNELANIGYVDASTKLDIISYRKKFVQQLIGPVKVDYSKPLTFLIPRLIKEQSQFILIAVTHADLLPDEFLQELWDLVLQNRFAKNRHHLNILVFGEKEWASRAKSWLPANSNNKPVLLANEFVERITQESKGMSELDQLISSKRQQFNERLAVRESIESSQHNLLGEWWVKVLLSIIFFVTFTGLLLSQYVTLEQAKSFYATVFDGVPVVSVEKASVDEPSIIDSDDVVEATELGPVEEVSSEVPSFLTLADDQKRVVDWEDAVKSLPEAPLVVTDENAGQTINSEQTLTDNTSALIEEQSENTAQSALPLQNTEEALADEFDYPVDDITSVEQLDSLNTVGTEADVGDSVPSAVTEQEVQTTDDVVIDSSNTVVDSEFDETFLTNLDETGFALQLSAMSTEEALNFFLQTNQLTETTWVYKTQRFGGDWFVVLHNQTFDSLESANAAIQGLALSAPPFAKPVSNIQQEITQN
jgi:DamX protein